MALAILASVSSFLQVCLSAMFLSILSYNRFCRGNYGSIYEACKITSSRITGLALYSILLIITFIEFLVSIAVSVYCCKQACCGPQGHPQGMLPTEMTHNGQMTYVAATSSTPGSVYQRVSTQQGGLQQQPVILIMIQCSLMQFNSSLFKSVACISAPTQASRLGR